MPQLHGKQIKNATVGTAQLAADAVEEVKILDSAVTTSKINDAAVTSAKLNTGVAGAGLTGGGGSALAVGQKATGSIKINADDIELVPDDVTLENDGSASPSKLQVKDDGITGAKLAPAVAADAAVKAATDMPTGANRASPPRTP